MCCYSENSEYRNSYPLVPCSRSRVPIDRISIEARVKKNIDPVEKLTKAGPNSSLRYATFNVILLGILIPARMRVPASAYGLLVLFVGICMNGIVSAPRKYGSFPSHFWILTYDRYSVVSDSLTNRIALASAVTLKIVALASASACITCC